MRVLRSVSIATLLGGSLLVGCGGGGGASNDTAKVKAAVTGEFAALADGNGAAACALATPAGQAKIASARPGDTCQQVIGLLSQRLTSAIKDGLRSAQVGKVSIKGDTATVLDSDITTTRGSLSGFLQPGSAPTVFAKQPDGSWKISG